MSLLAAVGLLREARLVQGPGVRAVAGGGRGDALARRLEAALDGGVTGIVSIGLGGALDPALRVGDVVIGAEAIFADGRRLTDLAWTEQLVERLPGARLGAVYGCDMMVTTPEAKARLRSDSGAAMVDMESHVAGRIAAERGLPFAILRVVSDTAAATLPPAVRHGMRPDGGMNLAGVLLALARRPSQLPALMRTGRDAEAAFKGLAALASVLAA